MSKFIKLVLISVTTITLLAACGPNEKDAQQAGFISVAEMKDLQAKGFKTKDDYAKSLGFTDSAQMAEASKLNLKNRAEYDQYLEDKRKEESLSKKDPQDYSAAEMANIIVNQNVKYQQAVLKTVNLQLWSKCSVTWAHFTAEKVKGTTVFNKDMDFMYELIGETIGFVRKNMLANGVPQQTLDDSVRSMGAINRAGYRMDWQNECVSTLSAALNNSKY